MAANMSIWRPRLRKYFREIYGKRHGDEALSLLEKLASGDGGCIAGRFSRKQEKGEI
jgi:hypothetical protein